MNDKSLKLQPSPADRPDLDWSQVRETVMMLNLAVAQISGAMQDGNDSVKTLTDSFTAMMQNVDTIQAASDDLPPETPQQNTISQNCTAISHQMQTAIIAFQFYDKLSQRLDHLTGSLSSLGELVNKPEQLYNPVAWKNLRADIKSRYTMESDKAMFDAILRGATIEEALQLSSAHGKTEDDDIELF